MSMKKKGMLRKGLAVGLCISLSGTLCPLPVSAEGVPADRVVAQLATKTVDYVQTFDDADGSNWVSYANPSICSVIDGKLDIETAQGNENKQPQYALRIDEESPEISAGEISAQFDVKSHAGRFAFVFHYQDENNFDALGYDINDGWVYFHRANGKNEDTNFKGPVMKNGTSASIQIGFFDGTLEVKVNGEKIFVGNDLPMHEKGQLGIRTWGYAGNYAHIAVDTISYSEKTKVSLTPDSAYVKYAEAGTYDVKTTLSSTENPLAHLEADGENLTEGTDYVVDGDTVSIKKEFVEKVKEDGLTNIQFVFEDGYKTTFALQVQLPPEEDVTYLHDFSKDGLGNVKVVSGDGSVKMDENTLRVEGGSDTIVIDEDSPKLYNQEVEFSFDPKNDNANFGVVLRYAGEDSWTYIGQDGSGNEFGSDWYVKNSEGAYRRFAPDSEVNKTDSARIYANRVQPYKVKVRAVGNVVTIFLDDAEIFHGVVDELTDERGQAGVRFHGNSGGNIQYLSVATQPELEPEDIQEESVHAIASEELSVNMDENFPRVIDYTLAENGNKMYGQETPYYYVEINTTTYRPTVTSEFTGDKAVYHMAVEELGITFDVVFTVEKNVLTMDIENVNDENYQVNTINFPNHSLVSMRSTEPNAQFHSANYNLQRNYKLADKAADEAFNTTSIATLSSDNIAASMANNSIKNRQEVAFRTFDMGDYTSTALWSNEYMYKGMLDGEVIDEPWAKVTITADRNKDEKIDYQDAAIAYRDDAAQERVGTEIVQNSYSYIAMNVGSSAQYPFLRILDNIKKFSLGTDNFGQAVIVKGYQSEGHDSAHPDYGNIGKRQGGEQDFKVLLEESEKYNTKVGVHINHTESYPESKYYAQVASTVNGWSWYDDAKQIIRENDILNEESGMGARLDELKEKAPGLDWVYVDVYGDGRWPSHKLSKKLQENGWAIASEYASAMSNTSIWGHHINSTHNGTGNLLRFVNHQTQENFGNSTLFRGQKDGRINGFCGWQGASDYNETIKSFFTEILPNKYLMNFPMSQWEKSSEAVFGYDNEVVSSIEGGVNKIRKDGKLIADGNKIFIPWNPQTEEKIYHWTDKDGETTWELPDSWAGVENVYLYKLTDEGRSEETVIPAEDGKVTLSTKANTGYVVYKEQAPKQEDMNWSEGSPVKDMGFDSHEFGYAWEKSSSAGNTDHIQYVDNNKGNTTLRVSGNDGADAKVTQTMTGLKPGQSYSASVWMEVSDGRRATIEVETPDGKKVSNYTDRSNVIYGVTHNDKLNTYYQRVKVLFTQPEGETTAKISLSVDKGDADSWANLDDVRVMPVDVSDKQGHDYYEDFENVDQGFGPFTSTKSDNSHLSETNKPYTNDTIDGQFSLKIRSGDYMRTMPHTIRFAPNTTYEVGLDCLSNADKAFLLQVRSDKAAEAGDTENAVVASEYSVANGSIKVRFTTGNYDDYYIDMTKANATEYIVDNLYVDEIKQEEISTAVLEYAISLAKKASTEGVVQSVVEKYNETLANAKDILKRVQENDTTVTQEMVDNAWQELIEAMQYLSFKQGDKTDLAKVIVLADEMNNNLSSYLEEGKEAFVKALEAAKAVQEDGDAMQDDVNTAWKNLLTAMAGLQKIPDKSALEELLNKAEGLNEADYEAASYAAFRMAFADAKAVHEDDQATAKEVDAAVAALDGAIAKLTPAKDADENTVANAGNTTTGSDNKGTSADKKDTNTADTSNVKNATAKSAKTGDEANAALPAAAGILAAVAAAFIWKKRR